MTQESSPDCVEGILLNDCNWQLQANRKKNIICGLFNSAEWRA